MRTVAERQWILGLELFPLVVWVASLAACGSPRLAPANPTWSDVQPILRARCASCHASSAATTGSALGVVYRLDFFDVTPETCGDAAVAMQPARFAAAASSQIAFDITSDDARVRPKMPPAPAAWLADWEWQTILRWTHNPLKGPPPIENTPPTIRVTSASRQVSGSFTLSVVLEDADGDSAVGILSVGDVTLKLDRAGTYDIEVDVSQWPPGPMPVAATACDGWRQVTYDEHTLGVFVVNQ
jgi:hypothetical protein